LAGGSGGKGNEGCNGLVKQTPNSIGYVELIYAVQNNIPYGTVKNSSGNFVKADLASVTAAASGAAKEMPMIPREHHECSGKTAYPISSFTWLLIPQKFQIRGSATPSRASEMDAERRQDSVKRFPTRSCRRSGEKEKKAINNIQ